MQMDAIVSKAINQMKEVHSVALSKLVPLYHGQFIGTPDMKLMESMMFGFTNPVLIDEEGRVFAGVSRVLAARGLELTEAPCITLSGLSFEQKRACALADLDLDIAPTREWDEDMLHMVLETHAIDTARDDLVWPYVHAREKLVFWLSELNQPGRAQALEKIKSDNRWNGAALAEGLDAVLAVMDYRHSVDTLYREKGYADSDYEEQYGEKDEDELLKRPVTLDEIAAELEVEKGADTAGRLLAKIDFAHLDRTVREGLLGASSEEYTTRLDRAYWKWVRKA
jgi:hypothetical protein